MEHEEPTNGAEKTELSNRSIPDILPILPLRNAVIYPFLSMPVAVSRPESMKLIEETLSGQKLFGVVAQKSTEVEDPRIDEMYEKIFEMELGSWCDDRSLWPQDRSLKTFWEWFDVEIHSLVIDTLDEDIQNTPMSSGLLN